MKSHLSREPQPQLPAQERSAAPHATRQPQPTPPTGSFRFQQVATAMGQQHGVDLSNLVATHHSSLPARLNAVAAVRGNQLHFSPGMDSEANIAHEVAHVIDNTLHGPPRGNLIEDGVRVDTSREATVDHMVAARKTPEPMRNDPALTERGAISKTPAGRAAVTSPVVQRLTAGARAQRRLITDKLTRMNCRFDPAAIQCLSGVGANTFVFPTITWVKGTDNVVLTNVRFVVWGQSAMDFNYSIVEAQQSYPFTSTGDPADLIETVEVAVTSAKTDKLTMGLLDMRFEMTQLHVSLDVIDKVDGALWALFRSVASLAARLTPTGWIGDTEPVTLQSVLGNELQLRVGHADVTILDGSMTERRGRGGYTGAAGTVVRRTRVTGNLQVDGLRVWTEGTPKRDPSYTLRVHANELLLDKTSTRVFADGVWLAKPQAERTNVGMTNLDLEQEITSATGRQERLVFNLEHFFWQNPKGYPARVELQQLQATINPPLNNGQLTGRLKCALNHTPMTWQGNFNVPIHAGVIRIADLETALLAILPAVVVNRLPLYQEANQTRLDLGITNPSLLAPGDDVVEATRHRIRTTGRLRRDPELVEQTTELNLLTLLDYHLNVQLRALLNTRLA